MANSDDLNNLPQATVRPKRKMHISVVWIIPIVAAIVGIGIAIQQILSKGPTITIVFKEAQGLEAGKTLVKYKDVTVGLVDTVRLSTDFTKVVVTAKIEKSAEGLIVDDAKFWIEQPRLTLSGVSGFETLLSGNYIGLEPGKSKLQRREFIGLGAPPSVTFDEPGSRFFLKSETLGSVGNGSPLYYRQLKVGQVVGYDLAEDGGSVNIEVFIRAPYDKYVSDHTRFWQASGIDASLGAEGISVRTQSVLSILVGGLAFETPPSSESPKPVEEKAVFKLFSSRAEAMANPETQFRRYVLYFNESLRGVNVGAPVTFLGLPVGEVTDVGLDYNVKKNIVRPRIDIVLYPRRFRARVHPSSAIDTKVQTEAERRDFVQGAIEHGFRAQLQSGNILTGQRIVAFELFPNVPAVKVDWNKTPVELPVVPSGLQNIESKLNSILTKIDKMPLEGIGADLKKMLATIDGLLKHIDGETMPEINQTLKELKRVITSIDNTLVGKDAPTRQQVQETLQEINRAAKGVSSLTEYLERNPEALIKGKAKEKP